MNSCWVCLLAMVGTMVCKVFQVSTKDMHVHASSVCGGRRSICASLSCWDAVLAAPAADHSFWLCSACLNNSNQILYMSKYAQHAIDTVGD